MASPSPDLDIEAQTNVVPEAQLAIIPDPLPTTNTRNSRLSTTADPHPQVTDINQDHDKNAPAQRNVENPEVQRGLLTLLFPKL